MRRRLLAAGLAAVLGLMGVACEVEPPDETDLGPDPLMETTIPSPTDTVPGTTAP